MMVLCFVKRVISSLSHFETVVLPTYLSWTIVFTQSGFAHPSYGTDISYNTAYGGKLGILIFRTGMTYPGRCSNPRPPGLRSNALSNAPQPRLQYMFIITFALQVSSNGDWLSCRYIIKKQLSWPWQSSISDILWYFL